MKISRHVMNEDGHTSSVRDKILSIRVKKGWKQGTRITFPEEGDQGPNTIPADISKFKSTRYQIIRSKRPKFVKKAYLWFKVADEYISCFIPNVGHFGPASGSLN